VTVTVVAEIGRIALVPMRDPLAAGGEMDVVLASLQIEVRRDHDDCHEQHDEKELVHVSLQVLG